MPQPLSSKEQSLFRAVVKNYESKQYKKGLKSCDQILRKSPNHGDTQAMKALLLNSLGQTDEAFALAKVALKCDMKSHVCWHVYGLLWRAVRNFEEAIKAYKFALKLEPESAQILRDLALLQVQMRDFSGYIHSRKLMLQAKPQVRANWTAMAIAHHLAGDLRNAEKVLTTYEDTLKNPPSNSDVEHSEAVLYKNSIIGEMGETERALEHLEAVQKHNLDQLAVTEMRAHYLLRLDRKEEAENVYRSLLDRNGECYEYYTGLEKAKGLDKSNYAELKELYGSIAQKHDRVDAARRIQLDFLQGDDFRAAADLYLRPMLQKGVPSTFSNVKALYADKAKRETIQDLLESYATTPQVNGSVKEEPNGDHPDRFHESVLFFLAQHYNYKLSRNLKKATELTERLIDMSPKTYDYPMTKARILKHEGNPEEASKVMNIARELDLRDRYINTKCAKYQLRNDHNDAALKTMSKFTKNDAVGGTLGDLHEMQSLWYITEDGEAYWRQGKLGRALKRFHSVYDIFTTWEEDQFDFHNYSLRKGQIRAYVDMIRWEDHLRDHPFYTRAAINATKVYVSLFDKPDLAQAEGLPSNFADLDDAEQKKALKKAKKEQEKLDKEDTERREADKRAIAKKGNAGADGELKKIDDDPRGSKLLETKEPLDVAMKFLNPLLEFGGQNLEAQHVGFEVYIRRKKLYLALKCILTAFNISPADPTTHQQCIRFRQTVQNLPQSDSSLLDLVNSSLPSPYDDPNADLTLLNDRFLASHTDSAAHVFAFVRARQSLKPGSKKENEDLILKMLDNCEAMTPHDVVTGIEFLRDQSSRKGVLDNFVKRAEERWPGAKVLFEREASRGSSGAISTEE